MPLWKASTPVRGEVTSSTCMVSVAQDASVCLIGSKTTAVASPLRNARDAKPCTLSGP